MLKPILWVVGPWVLVPAKLKVTVKAYLKEDIWIVVAHLVAERHVWTLGKGSIKGNYLDNGATPGYSNP